jgi:hypothetical protein
MLPPMVPALRIWSLAKWSQASTSTGRCWRTSGCSMISVIVASAPMRISLPSSVIPVSWGMWRMFIKVWRNLMRPAWLCGVRSVPPARMVTLPPLRRSTAWSRLVGAK